MQYAPLRFRAQAEHPGQEFEARIQQFKEFGAFSCGEKIPTKEEYIRLFISEDFASPEKGGGIGRLLRLNLPIILSQLGMTPADFKSGKLDWVTEFKDLYLAPCLFDIWGSNKQVYKPDPDFADALMNMKSLKISFTSLIHLPYNAFYLDLSSCYGLPQIDGVFVFLTRDGEKVYITQYVLADNMFFSYYTFFSRKEGNDLIEVTADMLPDSHYLFVPEFAKGGEKLREKLKEKDIEVDRRKIIMLCLQFIAYISSQEPDILESPLTHSTYKPSTGAEKNRFSEVRIWETGYRFGSSFRKKMGEVQKSLEKEEKSNDGTPSKKRKSPIPHFKCAHWQHYWVGKGRKECIVRFKEAFPASLSQGSISEAVIHKG